MATSYSASILGGIWWPMGATGSLDVSYTAGSDDDAIEMAQTTQAGDFSSVTDVRVTKRESCGTCNCREVVVKDWQDEETEMAYWDTQGEGE